MNIYEPMNCDLHDYMEIACLKRYRLEVTLLDGTTFAAKALDTQTAPSKEEFLILQRDFQSADSAKEGQELCSIRLDQIRTILPMESQADFGLIDFTIQQDGRQESIF